MNAARGDWIGSPSVLPLVLIRAEDLIPVRADEVICTCSAKCCSDVAPGSSLGAVGVMGLFKVTTSLSAVVEFK